MYLKTIITSSLLMAGMLIYGQESKVSMTDHLRNFSDSGSSITIHQDSRLDSLMNKERYSNISETAAGKRLVHSKGYRIQIFSGDDQRVSKAEAYEKEKELKNLLPQIDSYVSFTSPFWRLRVGNYRTTEEAHSMLRELKRLFPKWKEMYIVNERIEFEVPRSVGH